MFKWEAAATCELFCMVCCSTISLTLSEPSRWSLMYALSQNIKTTSKKPHTAVRASPHIAKPQLDSDSVHLILPLTKSKMSRNTIRGDVKSGQMTPIIKGSDKKEKIPFIEQFTVEKWKHWATSYAPLHKKEFLRGILNYIFTVLWELNILTKRSLKTWTETTRSIKIKETLLRIRKAPLPSIKREERR